MEQLFTLPGPVGALEALWTPSTQASVDAVAVLCHPHPLHGGTMHNKVVHTLMRAFRELDIASIRFNFRGVGTSEGRYAEGVGEREDLLAVLDWAQITHAPRKIFLAGFSFGACVIHNALATNVISAASLEHVILIAPPVGRFEFEPIESRIATTVIMGTVDEVVDPWVVRQWLAEHAHVSAHWLEGAGHFFHGDLTRLKETIKDCISQ